MQDEFASFALFDASTELISVFEAATLPEAVAVKLQYRGKHRKKFGCDYMRRASRGERRGMA